MTEGAIAHLDLQDLLRELLGRIQNAMEADNAAILLLDDDGTYLNLFAERGPEGDNPSKLRLRLGRGVAGTIASTGKPMIAGDLSHEDIENLLLNPNIRSLVGVPLFSGDGVIGVIHIDSVHPHRFRDEDKDLLQVIASRVALAVEHAQLYEAECAARREAEATARHLRALQAVSDVALEHARLSDLLSALLQHVQSMLEVENVAILLVTPSGDELTLYTVRGPEEAVLGKVRVPMGQGVAGTIAKTRKPLIAEDLAAVPVANPFLHEHFHSLLGVPLLAGERLIGVIHVDSVQPRYFTDEDRQLLQVLADRVAVAIARAQHFERVQQRRAEAEQQVAVLQEATERMDEFLSIASHELRTPLTSLTLNVQLLDSWLNAMQSKRAGETDEEYAARALARVRPLIQNSMHSVERLDRLVGDLLDASRIRERVLKPRMQRADLVSIVREAVEEQRQIHDMRIVRLELEASGPVIVDADPDRVGQVVSNYVSNALKYSDPGQPVTVTLQVDPDEARVSVRDEGVGIPEAAQSQIWDRFYRVEEVEHRSGSQVGLGLGLYICRDIIERHGGNVGLWSAPGEGSIFWFTLPLVRQPREESAESSE
ncbi:MAG TPA: GAF domain-containing protein [Ktedonobacterales bacterium]|nr:GAF domain-containing protein [Ktedonobacterales bacterium]